MKLSFQDEMKLHELIKTLAEQDDDLAIQFLYFIELLIEQNRELQDRNEELEEADMKRINNTYMWQEMKQKCQKLIKKNMRY